MECAVYPLARERQAHVEMKQQGERHSVAALRETPLRDDSRTHGCPKEKRGDQLTETHCARQATFERYEQRPTGWHLQYSDNLAQFRQAA